MGRKKKQKQITIKEETPIKYEGTVIIKKIKNGKVMSTHKTHNQGHDSLFKFLMNCLVGDFDSEEIPSWAVPVRVGTATSSATYVGSCENIVSKKLISKSDATYYVEYKFYFPYKADYNRGFNHVYVYPDKEGKHPSNTIAGAVPSDYSNYIDMSIGVSQEDTISTGEDLLIVWQLQIVNK